MEIKSLSMNHCLNHKAAEIHSMPSQHSINSNNISSPASINSMTMMSTIKGSNGSSITMSSMISIDSNMNTSSSTCQIKGSNSIDRHPISHMHISNRCDLRSPNLTTPMQG